MMTMLLAILERPDFLAAFALWAIKLILKHIFMSVLLLILGARVWNRIPERYQRTLLITLGWFLPLEVVSKDEPDDGPV